MAQCKYKEWLEPDGLLKVSAWARDGLINEQIAHNMGINRTTLFEWCKKYEDLNNALKRSKEVADIEVENALFKRAVGYSAVEIVEELTPVYEHGKVVRNEMAVTKRTTKEVPPDTTAQIYWLKNRKPEAWRERKDNDEYIQRDSKVEISFVDNTAKDE